MQQFEETGWQNENEMQFEKMGWNLRAKEEVTATVSSYDPISVHPGQRLDTPMGTLEVLGSTRIRAHRINRLEIRLKRAA